LYYSQFGKSIADQSWGSGGRKRSGCLIAKIAPFSV
jgi:hypothetical protein